MYYSLLQIVYNISSKVSDQKHSRTPIMYTIRGLNARKFVIRKVQHRTCV